MSNKDKGPHVSRQGGQEKNLKQTDKLNLTPPHSFVNIPEELKKFPQWVCWKKVKYQGKIKKIPIDSSTGRPASISDPSTWGSFERAIKYYEAHKNNGIEGVGFVFTAEDPYCGIDIDNCYDPETIEVSQDFQKIIEAFGSYTEISPSGTGVHIIIKGKLPKHGRKIPDLGLEVYDCRRYFTMTGKVMDGFKVIQERQEKLDVVIERYFDHRSTGGVNAVPLTQDNVKICTLTDDEIIEKVKTRNGDKLNPLWEGDWKGAGYRSQNEADLALCNMLGSYVGSDKERLDSLFRRSGLYRDKWDRVDYRDRTIKKSFEKQTVSVPKRPVNAKELVILELPKPRWAIQGILPEGLNILAGKPKQGKSILCLNVGLAVAAGGKALNKIHAEKGSVIYFALEDTLRRLKERIIDAPIYFIGPIKPISLHSNSQSGGWWLGIFGARNYKIS